MKPGVALSLLYGLISSSSCSGVVVSAPPHWRRAPPHGRSRACFDICVPSCRVICVFCVTIGFWPLFRTEDERPDQLSRVWGDAKL